MKVLIQQNNSFRYYRGDGDWAADRSQGKDFGNTLGAIKVIHEEKLEDVSILLTFEHSRSDLRLPVGDDTPRPRARN